MTQQEIEQKMREFMQNLSAEKARKQDAIERGYLMRLQSINNEMAVKIAEQERIRDNAQEEMMQAKIVMIKADGEERLTEAKANFERVRCEQEAVARMARVRINEAIMNAGKERKQAVHERDTLMRNLNLSINMKKSEYRESLDKQLEVKHENFGWVRCSDIVADFNEAVVKFEGDFIKVYYKE